MADDQGSEFWVIIPKCGDHFPFILQKNQSRLIRGKFWLALLFRLGISTLFLVPIATAAADTK
jgi:hypothetical protein